MQTFNQAFPEPAETLKRLGKSKFRSRFKLGDNERNYLCNKGLEEIMRHAERFIRQRVAITSPQNDGRQTPMRNHPAFIAMHATACCCRGCIKKWHGVDINTPLTNPQITHLLNIIRQWLVEQHPYPNTQRSDDLFSGR